jgi:hypothetical protein
MSRTSVALLIALVLAPLAHPKDKKKSTLPTEVLHAQTVYVMIQPTAGEPLTDPLANRHALEDVERSLLKWGRFRLAADAITADLVITVRKGNGGVVNPTIANSPLDNRPVTYDPTTDGNTRIGAQHGRPPGLSQPGMGTPQDSEPRAQTEIGSSEDMLEVYRGNVDFPLDSSPVWRYSGKDALRAPSVPALDQFRKAIDESEKAAAQNQKKKP